MTMEPLVMPGERSAQFHKWDAFTWKAIDIQAAAVIERYMAWRLNLYGKRWTSTPRWRVIRRHRRRRAYVRALREHIEFLGWRKSSST